MKKMIMSLAVLSMITAACNNSSSVDSANVDMENEEQKVAYSIGINVGSNLEAQGMTDIDPAIIAAGIKDVMEGNDLKIELQESGMAINEYTRKIAEKAAEENAAAGEKFLEENKKKEGWKVTESGLQYKVTKQGEGVMAKATDRVKVHYEGRHIDGEVFQNSRDNNGEPVVLGANQFIPGWTEALTMMNPGSVYEVAIPGNIAYGPRGKAPTIKPNEALTFTIELLGIEESPIPPAK